MRKRGPEAAPSADPAIEVADARPEADGSVVGTRVRRRARRRAERRAEPETPELTTPELATPELEIPQQLANGPISAASVLRHGNPSQPASFPYLGYQVPTDVRVVAQEVAIVLAVVALVVAVPLGYYIIGTVIAMAAALATAIAQPWLRDDTQGPQRGLTLVATSVVALAIVTTSVGALYGVIGSSEAAVAQTVPAPDVELYGLVGTPTPTIFDLRPGGCAIDSDGVARSNGTVVNLVNRPKRYAVTVRFETKSGTVLAHETDELQALAPQGAGAFSVSAPVVTDDELRCYVTEVRATNP